MVYPYASDMLFSRIVVVARKDSSGTTEAFTSSLSTIPEWNDTYGAFDSKDGWSQDIIKYYGEGEYPCFEIVIVIRYEVKNLHYLQG